MNRSDGKPKVYNKSHKTKWKIGMTLMNILDRKPLDKIRVQEICDSADIHRSTFYKHFGSVFDVVSFMTEEITGELTAQMDHADRRQDYMDSLVNFYVKYGRALRNLFQTKYREILELQNADHAGAVLHEASEADEAGHRQGYAAEMAGPVSCGGDHGCGDLPLGRGNG